MRRRDFIAAVGGASIPSFAAHGQQRVLPVVGVLGVATPEGQQPVIIKFRQGLRETGYLEGSNVIVEYRWARNDPDRLPVLAAELAQQNVSAIVSLGGRLSLAAAKASTSTIPIIFETGEDPVRGGFVTSLSRPGGNLTGVNSMLAEIWSKQFDLLVKLLPNRRSFALLDAGQVSPQQLNERRRNAEAAANAVDRKLFYMVAGSPKEISDTFQLLRESDVAGLVVRISTLFYDHRSQLIALAARYAIPTIYPVHDFAEDGGLMSYGSDGLDNFRLVGNYTGRILKGERTADMPVIQPTCFEFTINLKTARELDLRVPPLLLALADRVIE